MRFLIFGGFTNIHTYTDLHKHTHVSYVTYLRPIPPPSIDLHTPQIRPSDDPSRYSDPETPWLKKNEKYDKNNILYLNYLLYIII